MRPLTSKKTMHSSFQISTDQLGKWNMLPLAALNGSRSIPALTNKSIQRHRKEKKTPSQRPSIQPPRVIARPTTHANNSAAAAHLWITTTPHHFTTPALTPPSPPPSERPEIHPKLLFSHHSKPNYCLASSLPCGVHSPKRRARRLLPLGYLCRASIQLLTESPLPYSALVTQRFACRRIPRRRFWRVY